MKVQKIHKAIWDTVIKELSHNYTDVADIKSAVVERLYDEGKISKEACELLHEHNDCVLCVVQHTCPNCPLTIIGGKSCGIHDSLYTLVKIYSSMSAAHKICEVDVMSGDVVKKNVKILERTK